MMRILRNALYIWGVFLAFAMGLPHFLYGASCKQVDVEVLKKIILTTSDPKMVLVAAAIGQQQVLPALRLRMEPVDPSTPEGAAEAAAARLGDQGAVSQLKKLLEQRDTAAAKILGYAGTEQTLRIGFDYLLEHENDPSVFKIMTDVPDYGPGARFALFAALNVEGLPSPNDSFASWVAWWKNNRKTFKVTPPSSMLPDATLQCYGRIAEWDIGEGVRELYSAAGKDALPVIEHYAKRGDQKIPWSGLRSARGSAQAVLAKAGDEAWFKGIVNEFIRSGNGIDKLVYIGDSRSVEVLINALGPGFFHLPFGGFSEDEARKMQQLIFHALCSIVKNPPLSPDASIKPENVEIWRAWWQKTKGTVQFNIPRKECIDCFDHT
jgi:hypothetical protein